MSKYYIIPQDEFHRIHFVRPRFKNNIENVLLYMANACCKIGEAPQKEYIEQYTTAIRRFPGNLLATEKTIANWRTEIPALFGFYEEDRNSGWTKTTQMAIFLNEHQDLTQFLKHFLNTFQFPGGHLKSRDNIDLIKLGIRFKPAKTILQVLMEGNKLLVEQYLDEEEKPMKDMSISAEECTYCIFNDVRVTSGRRTPKEIALQILKNRQSKVKYYNPKDPNVMSSTKHPRSKGDVTRYAADILDYMVLGSLLKKDQYGYYSLSIDQFSSILAIAEDNSFFKGYEKFYSQEDISTSEVSALEQAWFRYVNDSLDPERFKTELTILKDESTEIIVVNQLIEEIRKEESSKNEIGKFGEIIIQGHEIQRLKIAGFENLAQRVKIVDTPYFRPGYDIESFEGDIEELHRYIEVKTTHSKRPIQIYNFHMTSNEWSVARTIRKHYYVYRLLINEEKTTLYILQDPVGLDKEDIITATPRNGMEISFDINRFETTPLLTESLQI